eukprot:COSAG01_NODE_235_length_20918_cov_41.045086_8_plen_136_part_00
MERMVRAGRQHDGRGYFAPLRSTHLALPICARVRRPSRLEAPIRKGPGGAIVHPPVDIPPRKGIARRGAGCLGAEEARVRPGGAMGKGYIARGHRPGCIAAAAGQSPRNSKLGIPSLEFRCLTGAAGSKKSRWDR